jgi:hypothetical protein
MRSRALKKAMDECCTQIVCVSPSGEGGPTVIRDDLNSANAVQVSRCDGRLPYGVRCDGCYQEPRAAAADVDSGGDYAMRVVRTVMIVATVLMISMV